MKINEIHRTSTFAWSSDTLPLLATGTVAGAVDINFDSSSLLEIWDTFLSKEKPIFTSPVENKFYALAWSKPFQGYKSGLLAGAFENGVIEFWDVEVLIKTKKLAKAQVHKSSRHSGRVRALQFSPLEPHVLVTGGENGQLFIWDTKTFEDPTTPGTTTADEITSVAWNNTVSHILATTAGGYTSIWDLKNKKEVLHLVYTGEHGKANFTNVEWHPTINTKLVTSTEGSIMTWDLRNSHAPEKVMDSHTSGVLSLDWCKQDPTLLISSGKDNNTFLWNPIEGVKLGEYPSTANWAFLTKFAPGAPDIFATASFDGKIVIQSLQDTSPVKVKGDDFWNNLDTEHVKFDIQQAPIWLKRRSNVSFGFGSKLVSIKVEDGKSVVRVQKVTRGQDSKTFGDAILTDDFGTLIKDKLENVVTKEDESDWKILNEIVGGSAKAVFNKRIEPPKEVESEKNAEAETENVETEKDLKTEETEKAEPAQVAGLGDDSDFFSNLGQTASVPASVAKDSPSGPFSIEKTTLNALLLSNKIPDAIASLLKQELLVEALILALDSTPEIKQTVRDAYFAQTSSDLSRIIYSVSSQNITDIVSNVDVSNWKQIAASIVAFSKDDFNASIIQLGDRILESRKSIADRDNAIACYLAGNALDKIANIWLSELGSYETQLLKSKSKEITSPSDARLASLTNFVEKIAVYRSLSNETGVLTGSIESVAKAILEYTNLVAGNGEFELAEKFLLILPSKYAGNDQERISKAGNKAEETKKVEVKEARKVDKSKGGIYGRSQAPAQPVQGLGIPSNYSQPGQASYGAPVAGHPAPPAFGQTPYGQPAPYGQQPTYAQPPANSFGQPPANSFGQPPYGQTAPAYGGYGQPSPYGQASYAPPAQFAPPPSSNPNAPGQNPPVPAQAPNNPYAKSNPYAPQNGNPAVPAPVLSPPPQKPSYKDNKEGWNDLPESFKAKPVRRAAAAATVAAVPTPAAPAKYLAAPPGGPPSGPKGPQGRASSSNINVSSPQLNKYAPLVSPDQGSPAAPSHPGSAFRTQSFGAPTRPDAGFRSQSFGAPAPPQKNPYAPNEATLTASPGLPKPTPPQIQNHAQQSQPSVSKPNPYAPVAGSTQAFGVAPPQHFGSPFTQNSPAHPGQNPSQFGSQNGSTQFGSAPPPPGPPPQKYAANSPQVQPAFAPPPQSVTPQAPQAPVKPHFPPGDRSHLTAETIPIVEGLTTILATIEPQVPEKYLKHVVDTRTRLNHLFDHLNNSELVTPPTIALLSNVVSSVEARDFSAAASTNLLILTEHSAEIGLWHVGVKRLVTLAESYY